jgi:hypothetical protein
LHKLTQLLLLEGKKKKKCCPFPPSVLTGKSRLQNMSQDKKMEEEKRREETRRDGATGFQDIAGR